MKRASREPGWPHRRRSLAARLLAALVASCSAGAAAARRSPRSPCSSTGSTRPSSPATTSAQAKGFYEDQGLDVTILEGGPGTPARDRVMNGEVDVRHHLVRRAARPGGGGQAVGGRHGRVPDPPVRHLLSPDLQHPRPPRPGGQEGGRHHRLLAHECSSRP